MKKLLPGIIFLLFAAASVIAQDEGGDGFADDPDGSAGDDGTDTEEAYVVYANQRGDQFMQFGLSVPLPINPDMNHLKMGGAGSIGYMRFLDNRLAVGGALNFGYHATIGKNVFYYVPITAKITYQPTVRRFEIPLTFSLGGAFENYLGRTYFGLFSKLDAAAYFRFRADWSVGAFAGALFMPQWYKESSNNFFGIIADIGITARYHF